MKGLKKKLVLVGLVVMMLGCSITASAAGSMRAVHEHAFSLYNEHVSYKSIHGGEHPYVRDGKTLSCNMVVIYYRDYYKCACGAGEYRNDHGEVKHCDCGL